MTIRGGGGHIKSKRLFATVAAVLDNTCTWFVVNKLSLNVSKTRYLLFHSNV